MITSNTLQFLGNLKQHNNKPWFDAHRKEYENAKGDFENFVTKLIHELGKHDNSISHLKAKDGMFRINRDIRFSKDKTPYKTNFGASINAEGKKSNKAGYYFHLEPGASFVGGGIWMPPAEHVNKIRQEIDYNFSDFLKIIQNKKFIQTFGALSIEEGQALSRVPKGYEADNPAAEYLKLKSFVVFSPISDELLLQKDLVKATVNAFKLITPLLNFLNEALN